LTHGTENKGQMEENRLQNILEQWGTFVQEKFV